VKFIFATTEIRKVPVTVLSRCQRFDLRRVSVAEMTGMFGRIAVQEGVAVASDALDLVARAADGSVRDGLSLLDQAIAQGAGDGVPITGAAVADMLGLADRSAVFDLMEAVMAGQPAAALAITDQAHERGADLGLMLGDLLDLTHTLTRLRTVPGLREGNELPEAERTRGGALADRLSMPVLARTWQMLLKGTAEVEQAPDRRAAAEMVLIRLCYAAELPAPGDLVRRLTESGAWSSTQAAPARAPASLPPPFEGGATRAVANGPPAFQPDPAPAVPPAPPPGPRLSSFRDVAMLVAERREPLLHGTLLHSVHLVRFAPPVIELRPEPDAPRDLASKLAALLLDATGARWTIALSREAGDPTLADQGNAADQARRGAAADHPLVRAILAAFPGAKIASVTDSRADAYGLIDEPSVLGGGDGREFAPLDAEEAGMMEDDR